MPDAAFSGSENTSHYAMIITTSVLSARALTRVQVLEAHAAASLPQKSNNDILNEDRCSVREVSLRWVPNTCGPSLSLH